MARKTSDRDVVATNRRARHDYAIEETLEAGIELQGTEVKSLRAHSLTLGEGYATVVNGEAYLVNVHIPEYTHGNRNNHDPKRRRRLLLHSREIFRLSGRLHEQGYTAIPMEVYFSRGWAKVQIGIGKGRKNYDKRHVEREKIARRELTE